MYQNSGLSLVQVLASKLDIPYVNFWFISPVEPFQTSLWRTSSRNFFTPNPLAYFPQKDSGIQTQYMVCIWPCTTKVEPWPLLLPYCCRPSHRIFDPYWVQ